MDKIPKDLKRWLKDNGHYTEFIRLVRLCGYTVNDLLYKRRADTATGVYYDYGIKNWFNSEIEIKDVTIFPHNHTMRYSDFLDSLKLNWR